MAKENKEWVRTRELWRFSWYNARESKRPPHRILIMDSGDAAWRLFSSIRIRKEDKKMNQICNNCLSDELKAKDEEIKNLKAMLQNMCAECECAKFADNAIKPSEMWKLHLALKDNK